MTRRNIAVVLAGGSGRRMGGEVPKQFLQIRNRMVIEYAVGAFDGHPLIDEVVIVASADTVPTMMDIVLRNGWQKVHRVLTGGKERYDSSLAAVRAFEGEDCNLIFHDAARPLVSERIITDVVHCLESHEACGVAVPCVDTILVCKDGLISSAPDRTTLRRAQTPQGFRLGVIADAYRIGLADPDFRATDDCGIVLRYRPDVPVAIVDGDEANMKVTYKDDIQILEALIH